MMGLSEIQNPGLLSFSPRVSPFSKRRQYQVLNLAEELRFKGKLPRGILCVHHPCNCVYRAWPEHIIQNAYFQLLPPLTRLSSSYFIQNASQNSSRSIQLKKKNLRKLKCKDYMRFLCIIIFSLHAPSPLFLFVCESSKETEQQRLWALMLTGKHPENNATEISGNFRTSYAKIIYQVHTLDPQAEV